MKRLLILPGLFLCALLVAACGQTGPLYLPGNPSSISNPPAEPAEEEPDEREEEENEDTVVE
jgi:predicted small lipoprotein YifL